MIQSDFLSDVILNIRSIRNSLRERENNRILSAVFVPENQLRSLVEKEQLELTTLGFKKGPFLFVDLTRSSLLNCSEKLTELLDVLASGIMDDVSIVLLIKEDSRFLGFRIEREVDFCCSVDKGHSTVVTVKKIRAVTTIKPNDIIPFSVALEICKTGMSSIK